MNREISRRIFLTITAGSLGFLANALAVPVVGSVVLLFGGIFYFPVALVYGPLYGAAAALIAASQTILTFGHPYALPSFAMEALAVGWLSGKRVPPLFADLLFWCVIGLPYHFLTSSDLPPSMLWTIAIKLPLNGLLNVILAELLLAAAPPQRLSALMGRSMESRPLRVQLLNGFALLAALPLLLVSIVHARNYAEGAEKEAAYRLQEAATAIRQNVDDYINKHLTAIVSLAVVVNDKGSFEQENLNRLLEEHHKIYDDFTTLLIADGEGRLQSAHPLLTNDGLPVLDLNEKVSDREYFKQPTATGKPYVSDVFLGRGYGQNPIVAVSAPLLDKKGEIAGIAEGSLNLKKFDRFEQNFQTIKDAAIIITDRNYRVIYSSAAASYQALHNLGDSALSASARAAQQSSLFQYDQPEENDARNTRYIVGHAATQIGWHVFIRQPLRQIQGEIERYYLIITALVLVGIGLSLLLARMTAGNITKPIERLARISQDFSIADTPHSVAIDSGSAPSEVVELVNGFKKMSVRLDESYSRLQQALAEREAMNTELQKLLADLDQKVQERTVEIVAQKNELAEANNKLTELDKFKTKFMAMLVHDLKSPLTIVRMTLDRIEDPSDLGESELADYIEASNVSVRKMLALINDLLEFSRYSSQETNLFLVPVDPAPLIQNHVDEARLEASSNQIAIDAEIEPDLPYISADSDKLGRAFSNILSNALKFTPKGGSIKIEARALKDIETPSGSTLLSVKITDTGEGIEPEELPYIFDPFKQAGSKKTNVGHGLGLAIAKSIVAAHSGNIVAQSQAGSGACFTVTLPALEQVGDRRSEVGGKE